MYVYIFALQMNIFEPLCVFIYPLSTFLYISFRISFIPETGKEPYMVTSLTLIYNDKYIFFIKI